MQSAQVSEDFFYDDCASNCGSFAAYGLCRLQPASKHGPQRTTIVDAFRSRGCRIVEGLRTFTATVAHDITQEGPLAWSKFFEDNPAFFMAVNGQMAFPSGAAAKSGIQNVALALKHIELKWGDDLRIDPLTPELAVVAAPWHEIQIDSAGHRVEETGFFTGLAELRDGRWQFRNVHWSSPMFPSPDR